MSVPLNASTPLSTTLAECALREADQPATAVTALVSGAASILNRDFGPEMAAQIMLQIVMQAHEALAGAGLIVEITRH